MVQKKISIFILVFVLGSLIIFSTNSTTAAYVDENQDLLAWWTFEKTDGKGVQDKVAGIQDSLNGNFRYVQGSSGDALKFDGFTTLITRKASISPKLKDQFTIEAWIAIAAYPWNWCPIVSQQKDQKEGYTFEVGPRGELGLKIFLDGRWQECVSETSIPLKQWTLVTGTFDESRGITLFIDGEEVADLSLKGKIVYAEDTDLLIGMNQEKIKPAFFHREFGTLPAWYSLDAIIDELKIYGRALSADEIQTAYLANNPSMSPDIPPRVMPSGPPGPGRFGAYYVKLDYYWEWDDYWRVADRPDVVVQFDNSEVRVVFWRGTRYSPAWVSENGLWMADQSVEAWDDIEGCFEHMQDHHCRYSHVRILENNKARIVVHWRYALLSVNDNLWKEDEKTGWGCWIDEYYYFFPDGTGIRKVMWENGSLGRPRQFQESIPFTHPGQLQGDVIYPEYVKIANLKGETQVFSYIEDPPKETTKFVPENPLIQKHNFKSKAKPFIIFEKGSRMNYLKDMNIASLSRPGSCSHWPVGQVPSDGRTTQAVDRASSFLGFPITNPFVHVGPESRNWVNLFTG